MKNIQSRIACCLAVLLLAAWCASCTRKPDDKNFNKYMGQDKTIQGKAGVLITALGQPEKYDYAFFDRYMNQIFNAAFPRLLKLLIMRDKGTVLRDPDNLFAMEEFKPKTLMDCFGSTRNSAGVPYTDLEIKWVKPREGSDGGHFLWERKNGYIDIVEKPSVKVAASYYRRMPGNRVPHVPQHEALFQDVRALLNRELPGTPMRTGWAMYPETVQKAIEELLSEKVETIVVCDLFPVYSNLEQFNALFVEIGHMLAGRAKVVYTPSVGAYASFRSAYVQMAVDEVAKLPKEGIKLLVLNRHGFPEMPSEIFHRLAPAYYRNLQAETEAALKGTNTRVLFADTEFSGEDDDPENKRMSSAEALELGLEQKYDHIIYVLVDFMSENTDTVYCAREEALEPIHFEYEGQVPYPDFSEPFRTELNKDQTKIIVAGTPVGGRYRPLVARGVFDALLTVLKQQKWPEMVL